VPAGQYPGMESSVELRQLRYFVAVAEELHFGRAAARLHMSQSPLSRAIRELERELGVVLFVRTTRRVELTSAGAALLERARAALAEIDGAIADARRSARPYSGVVGIGFTPVSRTVATQEATALQTEDAGIEVHFEEDVSPELLRRVASGDLAAAVVMETPEAPRLFRVRMDSLRDEQLLVALSAAHEYARAVAMPLKAFVAETVLLPQEPPGKQYNAWFRATIRSHGFELGRTLQTVTAPWDRRMLPVVAGEAVGVVVAEWAEQWSPESIVAVPFDPPLTVPLSLASCWPATDAVAALVNAACRLRDAHHWLTARQPTIDLPTD
jgi:DNA-binding transcriptional LysR family regulator